MVYPDLRNYKELPVLLDNKRHRKIKTLTIKKKKILKLYINPARLQLSSCNCLGFTQKTDKDWMVIQTSETMKKYWRQEMSKGACCSQMHSMKTDQQHAFYSDY